MRNNFKDLTAPARLVPDPRLVILMVCLSLLMTPRPSNAGGASTGEAKDHCPPCQRGRVVVSASEASLGGDLPTYVFCVYGRDMGDDYLMLETIGYTKRGDRELLGTLRGGGDLGDFARSQIETWNLAPKLVDMNFDGFLDVRLLYTVGATGNSSSHVWIYQPKSARFRYHETLSESDFYIDAEHRELHTQWNRGHAGALYFRGVMRWIGGEPVMVRSEIQDWIEDRGCYEKVTYERQGDDLVETSRVCPPEESLTE